MSATRNTSANRVDPIDAVDLALIEAAALAEMIEAIAEKVENDDTPFMAGVWGGVQYTARRITNLCGEASEHARQLVDKGRA